MRPWRTARPPGDAGLGILVSVFSRRERFGRIGSTQDIVRGWLAEGTPEVCLAVADEQTAGRGRAGRGWIAPAGAALLCSLGFRPSWLEASAAWRLAAVTALAMADAAEDAAGLPLRTIRLKWPNNLVVERGTLAGSAGDADPAAGLGAAPTVRKLAGLIGESDGLGSTQPTVVIGIGINADWAAADFPPDIGPAMTSLRAAGGGRPIDREALLDGFLDRLEARVEALRGGRFPVDDWGSRQLTTGRLVRLEGHGPATEEVLAVGVDSRTGALLVSDPASPGAERPVHAGEVTRVRLAERGVRVPAGAGVPGHDPASRRSAV